MTCQQTLKIYCGLYNANDDHQNLTFSELSFMNNPSRETKLFWPVLQAVKSKNILMPTVVHQPYKLIFSSKTAVTLFYTEIEQNKLDILDTCTGIYFVGGESKRCFQQLFTDAIHSLFVPKIHGMAQLIQEFDLTHSQEPLLFVVAKTGRSVMAIKQSQFQGLAHILQIYDVIPYESDFFVKKIAHIVGNTKIQLIFECRSGQILTQVSKFLMQYFACNDIISLPKNIVFSCIGQSTLDKVKELYGQRTS